MGERGATGFLTLHPHFLPIWLPFIRNPLYDNAYVRLKRIGVLFLVHPSRKHDFFRKNMKWQKIWNCGLNGFLGGILISNYKTSINNLFTTFLYIKSIFLNVWDISFLKITELKKTPSMILLLLKKIVMIEEYRAFEFVTKTPFLSRIGFRGY